MKHRSTAYLFTTLLLSVAILVSLFTSCSPNPSLDGDTIPVLSTTFPDLVAMEARPFDYEASEKLSYNFDIPRPEVFIDNGNLCIREYSLPDDVFLETAIGGHLYGVDCGEFGGYIAFCPEESFDPVMLCDKNCQGLIRVSTAERYGYEYYAITGLNHNFHMEGAVYLLTYSEEEKAWSAEVLAELGAQADAFAYDEQSGLLYLSTYSRGLLCMNAEGEITTLVDYSKYDKWFFTTVNSLVLLDGNIFLGVIDGVVRYSLDTKELTYFPLDYDTYWVEAD